MSQLRVVALVVAGLAVTTSLLDARSYAEVRARSNEAADRLRERLAAAPASDGAVTMSVEVHALWHTRCVVAIRSKAATLTIHIGEGRCA